MAEVFISYKRDQRERVKVIAESLRAKGLPRALLATRAPVAVTTW